ncbi:MAG: tetratricopeptide repeat protein [Acidobacteriia bacterium]|nr:tetratricopeptide repeat protein [Terriglobia bacterium]
MRLRAILMILFVASSLLAQAPPSQKPLTKENILQFLQNDVPSERLADLVERYGIDFEPTDDFLRTLRKAGATDVLLNALGTARRVGTGAKPGGSPGQAAQIKEHLDRAAELVINGDHEGVIAEGRQALQIDPKSADAHSTLAAGFLLKGDYESALKECHEAARLDPQNGIAPANCAWALYKKGKPEEAAAELRLALQLAPNSPHVHFVAALGSLLQGNPDGAITECHKALELDSHNFGGHAVLATALNTKGKFDEGAAEAREALRLAPRSSEAHALLGWTLMRKGTWTRRSARNARPSGSMPTTRRRTNAWRQHSI